MRAPRAQDLRREVERVGGQRLLDRDGRRGSARTPCRAPPRPPRRSPSRRAGARASGAFGIRYSASRKAIPWSVGAIRKTFGRVSGSTSLPPPSKTTPIGDAAPRGDAPGRVDPGALVDDRDRAVADGAPHVRDGAGRGERVVHRRDPQVVRRRRRSGCRSAFTSRAASRAPFSIARPRYGVRENGALTTIVSERSLAPGELPPQPAQRAGRRRRGRETRAPRRAVTLERMRGPGRRRGPLGSAATASGGPSAITRPASSTMTRSASRRTTPRLCSTTSSASPRSRSDRSSVDDARRPRRRDAPAVGSSTSSTRGAGRVAPSRASARAGR